MKLHEIIAAVSAKAKQQTENEMNWQQEYGKGDRLLYMGVPCVVSKECWIDHDICENLGNMSERMEVGFLQNGLPTFKRVSWSHKHLIQRDLSGE